MRLIRYLSVLMTCAPVVAGTNGLYADAAAWATAHPGAPYIAFIGDSIIAGGGGQGPGKTAITNAIWSASGNRLTSTNSGVGGTKWVDSSGATGQLATVIGLQPRWVFCQFGANDMNWSYVLDPFVYTQAWPTYWPTSYIGIYHVITNCQANNIKVMLGDILPSGVSYQAAAIPSVHAYNSNYLYLASANSGTVYYSPQHDPFGVWNPTTQGYDYGNPEYLQADELHLAASAYDFWAPIIISNLGSYFSDELPRYTHTHGSGTLGSSTR